MQNIPGDDDFSTREVREHLFESERIEQSLSRMSVVTIACIQYRGTSAFGNDAGNPGGFVTNDDVVRPHRLKCLNGVDERFTFYDG